MYIRQVSTYAAWPLIEMINVRDQAGRAEKPAAARLLVPALCPFRLHYFGDKYVGVDVR